MTLTLSSYLPLFLRPNSLNLGPSGKSQIDLKGSHLISCSPRRNPIRQIRDRRDINLESSGTITPITMLLSPPQVLLLHNTKNSALKPTSSLATPSASGTSLVPPNQGSARPKFGIFGDNNTDNSAPKPSSSLAPPSASVNSLIPPNQGSARRKFGIFGDDDTKNSAPKPSSSHATPSASKCTLCHSQCTPGNRRP